MVFDRNRERAQDCFEFVVVGAPWEMHERCKIMEFHENFEGFLWIFEKKSGILSKPYEMQGPGASPESPWGQRTDKLLTKCG